MLQQRFADCPVQCPSCRLCLCSYVQALCEMLSFTGRHVPQEGRALTEAESLCPQRQG